METYGHDILLCSNNNKKSIIVDLDGTVAKEDYFDLDKNDPVPGAKEALKKLYDLGFEIIIFTCRMNKRGRGRLCIKKEKKAIEEWLDRNEIPYTKVEDDYEGKPKGKYYLDNRAVHIENKEDWKSFISELTGEQNG